jgi:hypothetical protein
MADRRQSGWGLTASAQPSFSRQPHLIAKSKGERAQKVGRPSVRHHGIV